VTELGRDAHDVGFAAQTAPLRGHLRYRLRGGAVTDLLRSLALPIRQPSPRRFMGSVQRCRPGRGYSRASNEWQLATRSIQGESVLRHDDE
jgi:hypothetical protein